MARDTFPIKIAGIVVAVLLLIGVGISAALLLGGDDEEETEQIAASQEDLNELDEQLNDALARQRETDAAAEQGVDAQRLDDETPEPAPSAPTAPGSADRQPAAAERAAEPSPASARTTAPASSRTTPTTSASSTTGSATSHNAAGLRHFEQGEYAAALERFARARELAPRDPHVRNNYAWTLHKLNRQREAAQELDAVLELDPNREIAYANLGEVLLAQGDRAGAIAAYERFLELNRNPAREGVARRKLEQIRSGQ